MKLHLKKMNKEEKNITTQSSGTTEPARATQQPTSTTAEIGGYVKQSSTTNIPWINDRIGDIPWDEIQYPKHGPNPEGPYVPNQPINPNKGMLNYGWICPKCGTVFSPNVTACPYCKTHQTAPEITFSQPHDMFWSTTNTVDAKNVEFQATLKMPDDIQSPKLNS